MWSSRLRPPFYIVLQGFTYTFITAVLLRKGLSFYEKKYDAKLSKLYLIRGRAGSMSLKSLKSSNSRKKRILSSNVNRYSLLLSYTSIQTYQLLMKEFPFPSLSLLKKITEGQLDAAKCAESLKSQGEISEDVVLMFDVRCTYRNVQNAVAVN